MRRIFDWFRHRKDSRARALADGAHEINGLPGGARSRAQPVRDETSSVEHPKSSPPRSERTFHRPGPSQKELAQREKRRRRNKHRKRQKR